MNAHASGAAATLRAHHLTLRAGARTLVEDFTHTFYPGESWCIAGPNGAGKTTLIATLAGLLRPAAGHVELDGVRASDWPPARLAQRRALMPQSVHDAFSASVLDVVLLNRFAHLTGWGWERAADRAAAQAALARLGLADFARRDVLSLSGGERQRVALAAVLCQHAPLLLLDEPLAHLDLHHQIGCLEALDAWMHERTNDAARTVLFSCHDLNLARRFATHALLLDGRGATWTGPARDVLTPELASRAFGYPLALIRDGDHEALIPTLRPDAVTRSNPPPARDGDSPASSC
ncbi:ABC transporter ATP-binding protein [Paraburkholderia rhizosphaerae]|uniref:Iron complex transport system ATP-binding protein n=1 Tax=Paraburkholderia rhizosphaerae TaxID=480658 RepID=A0A4R8LM94_9BURK|nr:ABC transporter ATP-binding protein [Paraburkholderia rhizosphaerae]TDY44409.1 iron complex transport system ATP-binding protein [Paraburkholderia rhizosphaerae]